ncbi:hypothetical protein [uncultured Sunxiuqinia sp.]|uniref:hypothetical protein n=1 Tax=uncultured Sunxiuqinia sp. TaxID=1573825 RepID=UPI0030DC8185|tara:strand:+ start:7945 stop:8151 length:207 start_codon:yes stop_codon:yes gene_type:complete
MKRLNVRYNFPTGDQDHPKKKFPLFKRSIKAFKRHYQAQQISLLPAYYPDNEKPTVIFNPVGFFLNPF